MERVIYKYVFNHQQRNKLIYENQSGFSQNIQRNVQLHSKFTRKKGN